jgi:allantoicase
MSARIKGDCEVLVDDRWFGEVKPLITQGRILMEQVWLARRERCEGHVMTVDDE